MDTLRQDGDSIGAKINVIATGVPVGLGEPVFNKLDADIAHALMSINAVKGVEIGAGFSVVAQRGHQQTDPKCPKKPDICQESRFRSMDAYGRNERRSQGIKLRDTQALHGRTSYH